MKVKPTYEELENRIKKLNIDKEVAIEKVKAKAEESENYLNNIINGMGDPVFVKDDQSRLILVNDAFCKLFNLSRAKIMGKTLVEEVPLEERESFMKIDKQVLSDGVESTVEEPLTIRDAKQMIISTRKTRIINENGEKNLIGIIRDISDLKSVETKLLEAIEKAEESESKFRDLFEKSGDAIVINKNGLMVDFNQAMIKLFGYQSKDEFSDVHPSHISPEFQPDGKSSLEKVEEVLNLAAINGTHRFEWMHKKSNGEDFLCEILVTLINDEPNDRVFHGVIREITSYKKTEQELIVAKEKAEENQKLYKDLVQSSHNLIWKCDLEGKFTFLNSAWENTHGYKIEEMLGRAFSDFQRPEVFKRDVVEFTKHLEGGFVKGYETTHIIKDGTEIPLIFNALPLLNVFGEVIGTQGTAFDISKLKKTELELISAKEKAEESDKLKTEFINNMSHEIRTPMNGIMGFSGMLSDNNIADDKRVNFIKIIQNSGQQLLNVIDDILEISRLGTKQVKVVESDVCLNDVMLELFSTFDIKAKERNYPLYLKKALSDKKSTIRTDKTKLNKVLSNLLENALKFTNQGFIEFGYQLKNDNIVLYIKDTGIGIGKSKHESIFERFSQAEKDLSKNIGGLGLGLSIAKENAELLGGSIQLESKEGEGSTFFITIPYKPVYKVSDLEKTKKVCKYTILIAEDEEINHLYLEILLKDVIVLDCKIIHVTNGKEAIEACKENKSIDLVLMDLKMPILNGFEATKLIKKLRPNLPIIAQTAYSTQQDNEYAISVGCDDFISKPIKRESFKNILDKYLIIK